MKTPNIYLVGMMGSGKTVVGRRLAALLGRRFIDLDMEIEARAGMTVAEIFRRRGEAQFRKLEQEEVRRTSGLKRAVIALGGGAYCNAENQKIIDGAGISVWLDAPVELMFARCCGVGMTRPLLATLEEMSELLEHRRPFYERAHLRFEVAGCSVEELAFQISEVVLREPS